MKKFLMICYVASLFVNRDGDKFHITPDKLGVFIEAPEWIKETLLFKMLLKDGSIKVAEQQITMKQGENDPMDGVSAEGKDAAVSEANEAEAQEEKPAEEPAEEPAEKPAKKTTRKAKTGDAK